MSLAEEGILALWAGGPPCGTWSRLRHLDGGPPPLRLRGRFIWGLPHLSAAAAQRVQLANIVLLNFLAVGEAVVRGGGLTFLEHPEDPGVAPFASVWSLDTLLAYERRISATRLLLDQ